MGLSRLRLVSPEPLDEGIVRARAVHAADIWEARSAYDTFAEAIADCAFAVGVTRRRGHRRKQGTLDPERLAAYFKERPGPAAVIFGNERTGLTADELAFCNAASHIPSHEDFPSLNLSHAVQIYAYQFFRVLGSVQDVPGTWVSMNCAEFDELARNIADSLAVLGFYKQPGRAEQERFFRDIFSRAGLSVREAAYMQDIFAKAARLATIGKKQEAD